VKSRITAFQRVLIVQVFRPDRLESAMTNFVCEALGKRDIAPAPLSLQSLYENDTFPTEPILFLVTPGADPSAELQELAEMEVGRAGYHELAMGGGQNEIAIQMVRDAAEKGEWVCLKNLHLVTPWLQTLEKTLKALTPNKKFRLWLTSEPHIKFPSVLLQSSLKITYESPPGIKKNLQRTYQTWVANYQEGNLLKSQMMFILAWFHAILQERRTYIPQGWTKFYEFSYGDLKAGETMLSEVIAESKGAMPQWQTVYGLLENAIYGGRVDNEFDLRVLRAYLYQFFTSDVFQGITKLSNIIQVPKSDALREYQAIVGKLPDQDSPLFFGLPSNIDRSVQRFNSA
jgi:dynein heavy chain 2